MSGFLFIPLPICSVFDTPNLKKFSFASFKDILLGPITLSGYL